VVAEACPIINIASTHSSGIGAPAFSSVEFVCPSCGGRRWGTQGALGRCHTDGCYFTWPRAADWRVFLEVRSGRGFRSAAELGSRRTGAPAYAAPRVRYLGYVCVACREYLVGLACLPPKTHTLAPDGEECLIGAGVLRMS
jgi:hypothetical protein